MTSTLSQQFNGGMTGTLPPGEGSIPGSGGNNNTLYGGWGDQEPEASDFGYAFGKFPAGEMPSGAEKQEFRISDSVAFNNLRGIAKTKYPFDPFPAQDHPNSKVTSLADNFAQTDVSGVSSLLPGKFSYNNMQGSLSKEILQEFDAGTSTYNSLPWAKTDHALDGADSSRGYVSRERAAGLDGQEGQGINPSSLTELHRMSFASPSEQDVPLTPFHKQYPNFGQGHVDYGFQEPGTDTMSEEIIRAYAAVLPEGQLAGAKKELMPVFSGVNQEAIEQRPILQSLGKIKNTLYLGGVTELPDELRISPHHALLSGSNVPADLVQTAGELASALDSLGHSSPDGMSSISPYGPPMQSSDTLAGGPMPMDPAFYSHMNYMSGEPVTFGGNGYEYTSDDRAIRNQ